MNHAIGFHGYQGSALEDRRFDSWKEVAEYLGRDIGTCLKWKKKLGLPIYRIDKESPRSRIFAFRSEIDQWFRDRRA